MKKHLSVYGTLVLCFVAGLWLLSCASDKQPTNQNTNTAQNRALASDEFQDAASAEPPTDESICKITDIKARIPELRKKLKAKIEGPKGRLWDQLNGVEIEGKRYDPSFAFEFYPFPDETSPTLVYLLIAGRVHERKPFEDLVEYAEDFVRKGCADQVFFVGKLPGAGEPLDFRTLDVFQWSGCEYPLQMCTDGECRTTCLKTLGPTDEAAESGRN